MFNMSSTCFLLTFLPLFLLLILPHASVSAFHFNQISRLGHSSLLGAAVESVLNETGTFFFFDQTLDHFNYRPESFTTFKQKYFVNSKYWGGANSSAPIFACLGAEQSLGLPGVDFVTDNAPRFKALIVYIEHRFYGESILNGLSLEEVLKDPDTRGYFNSVQALADYAAVIIHVKRTLQAPNSPVIVFGASYGGMLAAWFRLKYPHIAHGALASSAPILLPINFTPHYGYYHIVSKGFRETSETCYETIKRSWSEIDRVASKPHGLSYLSTRFKTCKPLANSTEFKDYLITMYTEAAQYDDPFNKPVAKLCDAITSNRSSSILGKIFAGVVVAKGNSSCFDIKNPLGDALSQIVMGWAWQTCSDIIIPLARDNEGMFQAGNDSLRSYVDSCRRSFGATPQPHWISTYYGGQDMKRVLRRFGSNIIFSNGLKDPFSNGGILENISDTILAVYTAKGSHCLDFAGPTANDPNWLIEQRKTEVEIIEKWIRTYYDDLKEKA